MKFGHSDGDLSLLRPLDTKVSLAFMVLIVASVIVYIYLVIDGSFTLYTASPVLTVPFMAAGIYSYVINRRIIPGVIAIALLALTYFLIPDGVFFVLYLILGAEGVAVLAEILQRRMFFPIMRRIELIDSGKRGLTDRVVAFLFCIPPGMDMRDIRIDRDYSRSSIPVKSILSSMAVSMLLCLFLWMYVFMDTSVSVETEGLPIATFTIIMYMTLLVMPWTIYDRVNARVGEGHREFRLYDGFISGAKKASVPAVIALIIIMFAEWAGIENVFFALMTTVMMLLMVGASSLLHFSVSELPLINDIYDRWSKFHPIGVYSGYSPYGKSSMKDDVPGTPRRNPSESFSTDIRIRNR